jgi:hypothetical protein
LVAKAVDVFGRDMVATVLFLVNTSDSDGAMAFFEDMELEEVSRVPANFVLRNLSPNRSVARPAVPPRHRRGMASARRVIRTDFL